MTACWTTLTYWAPGKEDILDIGGHRPELCPTDLGFSPESNMVSWGLRDIGAGDSYSYIPRGSFLASDSFLITCLFSSTDPWDGVS